MIYLNQCEAYIINNDIFNNDATGIHLSSPEKTYIIGNKIEDNYKGVIIATTGSIYGMVTLKNNSFNNKYYNLYYHSILFEINLDAEYNYWGTVNKSSIKSMIEYHRDSKRFVDFEPWLDENGNVYQDEITDPSNNNINDDSGKNNNFIFQIIISIISIIIIIVVILIWFKKKRDIKN